MEGIAIIDKQTGVSSTWVVNRVKKYLKTNKAGHIGTLDPFASGVLPVCLSDATRIIPFLNEEVKEYIGVLRLGVKTDSLDSTGKVIDSSPVPFLNAEAVKKVLEGLTGETEQIPPMYSAVKKQGVRMYELARKGIEVEREPRRVVIDELKLIEYKSPEIKFFVRCSKGTYVRVLGEEIASRLETLGHLNSLRRLRSGNFRIEDSYTLDDILEGNYKLLSIRDVLGQYKELSVNSEVAENIALGKQVLKSFLSDSQVDAQGDGRIPKFREGERLLLVNCGRVVSIADAVVSSDDIVECENNDVVLKLVRVFNS